MLKDLPENLANFFRDFSEFMTTRWGYVLAGALFILGLLLHASNDGGVLDCVTSMSGYFKDADC